MMHRFLVAVLMTFGLSVAWVSDATASLKKYDSKYSFLNHFADVSPQAAYRNIPNEVRALIDDSALNPVLVKLRFKASSKSTTVVPSLSGGFIFFSQTSTEGPPSLTGTGSTASSINWGNATGWTVSGGTWCQSVPSYVCALAGVVNLVTIPTPTFSTNFDVGTWTFHGTGYTSPVGYIARTGTDGPGNSTYFVRGVHSPDGTVPALPLMGLGAVMLSVLAMGVSAARRR